MTKLAFVGIRVRGHNVYGFINKPTKLHPDMDVVLLTILANDANGYSNCHPHVNCHPNNLQQLSSR
jgi:hypothetical protein